MAATVIVNNLTVVHKTSGGSSVAAPDVCKTPTPGGPVPIPYVNTALSRHTAKGSKQVRADGQSIMLKSSHFSTSTGDEPGTLGGVVSGKTRGRAYPRSYSFDVKVEGQPVCRFTDMMVQNSGSPANAAGIVSQPNVAAPASNADKAELVQMRWSKTQLCCGDPVTLAVETRNADDGQVVQIRVDRTDMGRGPMEGFPAEIKVNKAEVRWKSRWRHIWKEKIPAVAAQGTLKGPRDSVNALEFRNPPTTKELIKPSPAPSVPQYELDQATGQWVKNGKFFGWDVCYELELSRGQLFLRRKLDFNLGPGLGPVAPSTWRTWKAQIESVWDHKFYFHRVACERGDNCDCGQIGCCKYPLRILAIPGPGHGSVDLFAGAPKAKNWGVPGLWWYSHTWWTMTGAAGPYVRAHEFGHLIGCYDEYAAGACHSSRAWVDIPGSIMNDGNTVHPRHVEDPHKWFVSKAGAVVGAVKVVRI